MIESNRIEYKQEPTDSLEKEVTAFLNYKEGGVIYIGITRMVVLQALLILTEISLK